MRPLRELLFVSSAFLLTSCSGGGPAAPEAPGPTHDPREVLVRLAPNVDIAEIHERYGTRTIAALPDERVYLLSLPAGDHVAEVLPRLERDVELTASSPNARIGVPEAEGRSTMAFADPSLDRFDYSDQAALDRIRASRAWSDSRGAGVLVAVLDTGIDRSHPGLGGRAVAGVDVIDSDGDPADRGDGIDNDRDGLVDEAVGHGTFVAGLVLSVAPDARILPIRVLDSDGVGTAFDLARALDAARDRGARVVNLSLGMADEADAVADLIDEMADEGIVFVASAGNSGTVGPRHFPAGENDVIGVAATDPSDRRAPFSNLGSWVDVAAPGVGLVSLYPGAGYATWSGTSFAAALTSGAAALLVARNPAARVQDIRDAIVRSAVPSADRSLNGVGRLDLPTALRVLLERAGGSGSGGSGSRGE